MSSAESSHRARFKRSSEKQSTRKKRRQNILESLESRQLLAGPQLIGIQPNVGELIVDGSTVETAPRVLTLRFDEDQRIDPATLDAVKITRAGEDGELDTGDDVVIEPGLVTLGDTAANEVVVRFSDRLTDDEYKVEVFGYDDPSVGIVGLRNEDGELLQTRVAGQRVETTRFDLQLGALIESVVPQPVIRLADGSLHQNRNEIVVFFNEDPLFTENDEDGNPTIRSAENPRFYQLLLTQDTVRNTDDALYHPERVVYDSATNTARLIFSGDLNELAADADGNEGVGLRGGTFRLRIGTAVDDRVDVILPPTNVAVAPSAISDFGIPGLKVVFTSAAIGESASGRQVRFEDSGAGGLQASLEPSASGLETVVFNLGGDSPTLQDLQDIAANTPAVAAVLSISVLGDVSTPVPNRIVGSPPLTMTAVGDTLGTSLDVGVFGQGDALTSLVFTEAVDPQTFLIEPAGSDDDPAHTEIRQHINSAFGPDVIDGVTEIAYNFKGIFEQVGSTSYLNQISEVQKVRIREALNLWGSKIGVQFRETEDEGIIFAVGDDARLQPRPGTTRSSVFQLDATLRIDPDFSDSAMVFDSGVDFQVDYGEDFTRKAVAGIGLLLGLNAAPDLPAPTIMSLNSGYLNASIEDLTDLEPVFPNNYDVLHGQFVHRTDSVDIDMYRFEVDLDDPTQVGTLTAETFAERLADSSLLDTTLTLFEEVSASVTTDFGLGIDLSVTITSLMPGRMGNNSRLTFVQSDRGVGDTEVRILQAVDLSGNPVPNGIIVDLPRIGPNVTAVPASDLVNAINDDPFASSIFRAAVVVGDPATNIGLADLDTFSPLLLAGGGIERIHRNDDYFGEDSRIIASLGEGIYYLGVSASGNDQYDPTIPGTGNGGRTQGRYDLHLKFEPQVDETDVLRDLDSSRVDVPGTPIDGDGDGVPGGVHNFWFQTRSLDRKIIMTGDGSRVNPGQVMTITSGSGVVRRYEFVPSGGSARPGNIAVFYNPSSPSGPTSDIDLAQALQAAINGQLASTGVVTSLSIEMDGLASRPVLTFSGERSVSLSTGFSGVEVLGRTIFVDKAAGPTAEGTLDRPFNNISNPAVPNAFGSTSFGDIVRIVGNRGLDNDIEIVDGEIVPNPTADDNFSYQIGTSEVGGVPLEDGRAMNVPRGVTTMIDAGAAFKLRNSYINVGSSTVQIDRSGGALQVLGTPRLVQLSPSGAPIETTLLGDERSVGTDGFSDGSVIFTSTRDRNVDAAASGFSPDPAAGNWGGIIYRRDIDRAEGRRDLEDEGIFLQRVNHAEIRYGGGSNVLIDSVQQLVNPVQIVDMRPTVTFNQITNSADSAISAAPNSFAETSFQAPQFQRGGAFTADYDRVGPDIHNNLLLENSINGLFVRVTTTPVEPPREFTVAARFDDTDIVHYVSENLVVAGNPGGSIQDGVTPSMGLVSARRLSGGLVEPGDYQYKVTFVDADGFESLPSADTFDFTVTETDSSVQLTSLPTIGNQSEYLSRRLYRADASDGRFFLVAELDGSSVSFIDTGATGDAELDLNRQGIRGRLDASLVMDPGLIMKLRGARIEMGQGTQILAEGALQNPIVFTSSLDDRFGAGGTFDTNNDNNLATPPAEPQRGDWSGIYAGPTSNVSFDHVQLSYAGGISLLPGGLSRGFLPLELQQAEGRITNSRFEFNDEGQDGAGPAGRFGRLAVTPATIMIRGSQPIIVGNTFVDNRGSIIDIDIESMGGNYRLDAGRQTGPIDRISVLDDNHGPMVRFNRYENDVDSGLQLSGMEIRAGLITTETVFDDTDIAHLLFDDIEVGNFHSSGGLRLLSRPDESLVVKFSGPGNPNDERFGTGITASGSLGSFNDARVGGTVHIVGMPGAPVILTSLHDDAAGAGLKPDGSSFTDHDGDGISSRPFANDWRGLLFDQFSNDQNVLLLPELELLTEVAPGLNATVGNAQFLGELAKNEISADHDRRAGFEVDGFLSGTNDIDTYSFVGSPGTEVWIDLDTTTFTLDSVVELLDADGNILARSDNSSEETLENDPVPVTVFDPQLDGVTTSLQTNPEKYTGRNAFGLYDDFASTNPRDAGIHFPLPGDRSDPNSRSVYFLRVRSASINPDDSAGGITGGQYRMQIRLTEEQAFPGSFVRFSDIRYANHGVHVQGLMSNSPLLGEAQENEAAVGDAARNDTPIGSVPGQGAQYVGNLVDNYNGVIGVGGSLTGGGFFSADIDLYEFEIDFSGTTGVQSTIFDIDFADGFNRPDTNISVFYDRDGVPPFESPANELPQLVFFGSSSNVLDDLTSPNGENDALERLIRGSITTGDPLIGPVALPEGTYYVAITPDGVDPLSLIGTVREPINSVDRIVEDRVDRGATFEPYSTADGPVIPRLFSDDALANSVGFGIVDDTLPGHTKPNHFDGSSGPFIPPTPPVQYTEFDAAGVADVANEVSTVNPNTEIGALEALDWSIQNDSEIGGAANALGIAPNTSTQIPHITVNGNLSADAADFYEFVLATPGRVIVDIDNGYQIIGEIDDDDDPATPPIPIFSPNSVDTKLVLLEADPNNAGFLRFVNVPQDTDNDGDVDNDDLSVTVEDGLRGSDYFNDAFFDTTLPAGTYYVGVLEETATLAFSNTGVTTGGGLGGAGQTYRLHVSVEDHALPPDAGITGDGIQVIAFDRSASPDSEVLTSEAFDLAGYVPADQPLLYLNQRYSPAPGDLAQLVIVSNENPTGQVVHTFTPGGWEQLRISLDDFAGHTGIQLLVDYQTDGSDASATGLRLDDFIVGFAERGETVFEAATGTSFSGSGFGTVPGEYQLEIRKGTEFAATGGFGTLNLTDSFDTNDRHNRSFTLVAPAGSQITDGGTFVLSDGAATQTFEFNSGGGVSFGNTPVQFDPSFTAAQVAERIRFAINSQSIIQVEASTSGGLDGSEVGGGTPTDGRLALSGARFGSFEEVDSTRDVPLTLSTDADGNLLIPAIFHDGLGDPNFKRLQGVVLVEHNEISDVRGIGVWSEPGYRDSVPRHERNNFLLEAPPVGNSYPGAVLNLPTLNDSVLGGLAPSLIIENNTIDHAEFAGIKTQGQTAPWVIEVGSGDTVTDGTTFVIDAGGTRVTFEFEDIGDGGDDAPAFQQPPAYGSQTQGGDGVTDGHVPIFYRHNDDAVPPVYRQRASEYTPLEMLHAIREAIQGSILMTNGLAELVEVTVGPSLTSQAPSFGGGFFGDVNFPTPALYIEGASAVYGGGRFEFNGLYDFPGLDAEIDIYQAPIYEAPQPFAKIVNNTIYGDDGRASESQQSAAVSEPNDFIIDAIDTRIGGSHRDVYSQTSTLGDNSGPLGPAGDVDFYRVYLEVGDRLVADIDTELGSTTLAADIDDTTTSISVNDFSSFSQRVPFDIDVNGETMTVVNITYAVDPADPSAPPTAATLEVVRSAPVNHGGGVAISGPGRPDTSLRVLNEEGVPQVLDVVNGAEITVSTADVAPDYLDPASTVANPVADAGNAFDPFVDFIAPKSGVYYVGVSSDGNENYDARSLSGRVEGVGGTGEYTLSLQTYAPRSFVMSLTNFTNINGEQDRDRNATTGAGLLGTTFTITQIEDIPAAFPQGDGTNQVTFEFSTSGAAVLGNGNVNVQIGAGDRVPTIMRAIELAITRQINVAGAGRLPVLPNYDLSDYPNRETPGAVRPGDAQALGGRTGQNAGVPEIYFFDPALGDDFNTNGFGHARDWGGDQAPLGSSAGSTELYVLVEKVAQIELSPEAVAAGLKLDPAPGRDTDQLINETGVMAAAGASPTLVNNVFVNLHESLVVEATHSNCPTSCIFLDGVVPVLPGLSNPASGSTDLHPKRMEVILAGNVFQDADGREVVHQGGIGINHGVSSTIPGGAPGTSNVNGGEDDFNFTLNAGDLLLQYPEANNFQPDFGSQIIDSAVNSVVERDALVAVRTAVGLPVSNIVAPTLDVGGVLRADNPDFAPPGGIGGSVFKDRGSVELADFVGPIAIAELPRDNDASGIDGDPSVGFINLTGGTYREFRIQLRDNGDSSDPFTGIGIDDSTVVVPVIPGLRPSGANVTLLENERLLQEGVDYIFNYDESRNLITLTPLAGVWQNDRAYRIEINNQDRDVVVVPSATEIEDGDQMTIIDKNGGEIVFEFESGYSLFVPEAITLVVPRVGTNTGGISDGDLFQLNDGTNLPSVFEFNEEGSSTLPGTIPVLLPSEPTPNGGTALDTFLAEIATNMATAIQGQVDLGLLDVDVEAVGSEVVIGGDPGTTAVTNLSGLQQLPRTLALQVPQAGVGIGGIADGDTFQISNGTRTVSFEFDTGNGLNTPLNRLVDISGITAATDVAVAILDSVANSGLGLNPSIEGDGRVVYLNLPLDGSATVPRGQLSVVGLSRPAADGDLITLTPNDGGAPISIEINRTDGPNDGVDPANIPVDVTRSTTADEFAEKLVTAIGQIELVDPTFAGLTPVQSVGGGVVVVGGEDGLGLTVSGTPLEVTGSPAVTGASTVAVSGPLILSLPLVGGGGILDGSVLVLTSDAGNDVIFEFNLNNTAPTVPGSIAVGYNSFDTVDVIANSLATAINTAAIGITSRALAGGRVDFGRIADDRVDIDGSTNPPAPGLSGASLRRGIVRDGEVLSISQGGTTVRYEFEAATGGGGVTPGNVPVPFQPTSSPGEVALSLAATIENNKGGLRLEPRAERDSITGELTGRVLLNDIPGTVVDVSLAPTLALSGVPGGAEAIQFSSAFSVNQIKQNMIDAINNINEDVEGPPITTLQAEDRGGNTFFVSGADLFGGVAGVGGIVRNFSLPAIKDTAGNPLKANLPDLSTQFTILMPTATLDFGDAPDPVRSVRGRYPTTNANNGARHEVDDTLKLGATIDANPDGLPGLSANGDDVTIGVSTQGTLFTSQLNNGLAEITIDTSVNPLTRDGDTITIDLGTVAATLEFDVLVSNSGAFDEDNFAIRPEDPNSAESIAKAVRDAIVIDSPLNPASVSYEVTGPTTAVVRVSADDEDGVVFTSDVNPTGVLNHGVATPIEVTITGDDGILEAWIDFNADGDWDDPGEQIIPLSDELAAKRDALCPTFFVQPDGPQTFCIVVPDTVPVPPAPVTTYARFRVSREGGLSPTGLALSGEVEDYALQLVPGLPPQVIPPPVNPGDPRALELEYESLEDVALLVLDADGTATPNPSDDGILKGIVDPDGDQVAVYSDDVGIRTLSTPGGELAGELNLAADGTFTFLPEPNFFGTVFFSAQVTDVKPLAPETELVSPYPIQVTITVQPVNDPPVALNPPVVVEVEIDEDAVTVFTAGPQGELERQLIDPFYVPGPPNESDQPMLFSFVGINDGVNDIRGTTELGGTVFISADGQTVTYTPPADFNSETEFDSFIYKVADDPGPGQLPQESQTIGTVLIKVNAVNDPPIAGTDTYTATPDNTPLTIPFDGQVNGPSGILDNDVAGPQDEIDAGQTVVFFSSDTESVGGATITRQGNNLIYNPDPEFSGVDQFTYTIESRLEDGSVGLKATGTVRVTVIKDNAAPVFVGINGVNGLDELDFIESKGTTQVFTYDLNTWFREPDNESMTFAASSGDIGKVLASVTGSTLRLELLPYEPGENILLTVTATDQNGLSTSQPITVNVADTPDPPVLVAPGLTDEEVDENAIIVKSLSSAFFDPDQNDVLTYSVARLGNLINPTPQQIANHPLVRSIEFVGDDMRILLQPNAFDEDGVDIEVAATDQRPGATVSDTFTLTVNPVPDAPVAVDDVYSVAVGASLQVLDPANGLLKNDFDVDGDSFLVEEGSIVGPSKGTLDVNPDGTFVFTVSGAIVGETVTFTYRIRDNSPEALLSDPATVTINLTASGYQNPLPNLQEDVNADGEVTAIDALRVINYLALALPSQPPGSSGVPVSEIGSPPPDYYDVNGDGLVSASDALAVVNRIAADNRAEGESVATLAVTTGYAAAQASGLPVRNLEPVMQEASSDEDPLDVIMAGGVEITRDAPIDVAEWIADDREESSAQSVDEALSLFMDEISLE